MQIENDRNSILNYNNRLILFLLMLKLKACLGFPGGSAGKESACNEADLGLIPGLGRSPGGGHGNPVFLPGESPRTEEPSRRRGHKELDMTE